MLLDTLRVWTRLRMPVPHNSGREQMTPDDLVRQVTTASTGQLVDAIIDTIRVHEPINAIDYGVQPRHKLTQVCVGCGQDNGDWNYWPCPTIRAIREALQ